ncbi:MAG TPA: FAD-dependent oxidoreductase [Candidatus Paceibacterota bacterium]|nr:FAD-dependent oxidoreductase [Candidatus Paceibacterota bacterium]
MAKKSVVVLGAGFGGLRAAIDVAKGLRQWKLTGKYEVALIDRNDCHLFVPLLYKVAASPDPQHEMNCTYGIRQLIAGLPIRFVQAEVAAVDCAGGTVTLASGDVIHGDYLAVALGSETNFFGIPGLKENALQLRSLESAMAIRAALAAAFAKSGEVKVIAGGGGPNGIELAAEIREWADREERVNPGLHVSVSIIEAMPGILTGFDAGAVAMAEARLEKLGVALRLNAKITAVAPQEISIADGTPDGAKVPFDVFIWTGGLRNPDLLASLPGEKDRHGKPMPQGDMQLAPAVYGIGDNVCYMDAKTGRPVPAVAHAAILEGGIAARNIIEEIKRVEFSSHNLLPITYSPRAYPYVIPIGGHWALAKIGPFIFGGWPGWEFSRLVELNYLSMIMPPWRAWKTWRGHSGRSLDKKV